MVTSFRDKLEARGSPEIARAEAVSLGRALSDMLLPRAVHALLRRSIERVPRDAGVRLRLCLDESLIDLPWELLFDPDEPDDSQSSGFLALSARLSLVRCAQVQGRHLQPATSRQRVAFAGALYTLGKSDDGFETRTEHVALQGALAGVEQLITVEKFVDASGDNIEKLLSAPAAIFHYAGHADVVDGQGVILRSLISNKPEWLTVESLAPMLQRAGTRLVVLIGCGSGHWPIVKPLLRPELDLAAVIGIQGLVDTKSAIAFCGKLYEALALGLSLDEAVTWARFHILEQAAARKPGFAFATHAWPRFMVYMPTSEAVLFPKPGDSSTARDEDRAREQRAQTINNVTQIIGAVYGGSVASIAATEDPPAARAARRPAGKTSRRSAPERARQPRAQSAHHDEGSMSEQQIADASESAEAGRTGRAHSARARDYVDLTIELRDVDAVADTFVVTVLPSPVGESEPVTVPLRLDELKQDLARLERKSMTSTRLMTLGERLGDRLLPTGEVRDVFKAAMAKAGRDGGVRLRLVIRDASLAQLPWEYAYIQGPAAEKHRSGFLLLNPQVSMVRHEAMPEAPWPLVGADPSTLRLVVATAGVTHANIAGLGEFEFAPLDVDLERDAIMNAVNGLVVDGVTVDASRVVEHATVTDVTAALLTGADVFHFAGHGYMATAESDPDAEPSALGGAILLHENGESEEGAPLRADDLAMTLQRAGVRLAVLGACETARRDGGSPWNAVAPALVRRGLPAAVAMQYEVLDEQATAFSKMLYTALASGLSLDEAVSTGRQAMLGGEDGKAIEWGVPVVYMRSTSGVLFPEIIEQPSPTGDKLRLVIDQVVETIEKGGEVLGLDASDLSAARIDVKQQADVVKGTMVGARIGRSDTKPATPRRPRRSDAEDA
jgi:hypothetical protein